MTHDLRHATLPDMIDMLKVQRAHAADVIVPDAALDYHDGLVTVRGADVIELDEPIVSAEGVTTAIDPNGTYLPTEHGDASMADALGIPVRYMRKLRDEGRGYLLDANVRGLLRGRVVNRGGERTVTHAPSAKSHMLRLFTPGTGQDHGVLRAFLSDRYGSHLDNLDTLLAVMAGFEQAGVAAQVYDGNLTSDRMNVRFYSPEIAGLAPTLLSGYRSPWDNANLREQLESTVSNPEQWRAARANMGHDSQPIVFAGCDFTNSEVGRGAFDLSYKIVVQICTNGMTTTHHLRKVHLGARHDEGTSWNTDVQRKQLAVITAQVKQKITEWFTPAFLATEVNAIEAAAGAPVTDAKATVEAVATRYKFTEAESSAILAHFYASNQMTAGGLANAITSASQALGNAERQDELDAIAITAMSMVK